MNFKAHITGGVLAGGVTVAVSQIIGYTDVSWDSVTYFLASPSIEGEIPILLGLFSLTLFMSLFPDLDSASILQRWFYRIIFVILLILFFLAQHGLFASLTLLSLLPLLHKHRGWMHSRLTPFVFAVVIAVMVEFYRSSLAWFGGFSASNIFYLFKDYWIYLLGCVLGHYTHLILDWRS